MAEKLIWTVDVEHDWGGRTNGIEGLIHGVPKILRLFKKHSVRGLFFVSTELFTNETAKRIVREIHDEGHEIGSHGHFHCKFISEAAWATDRFVSDKRLSEITGRLDHRYRAPKFNRITSDEYSNPKNHVGLLKYMWVGGIIPEDPIFYLHPFDIVGGSNPPNLFCRLWYSNPKKASYTLENLMNRYA